MIHRDAKLLLANGSVTDAVIIPLENKGWVLSFQTRNGCVFLTSRRSQNKTYRIFKSVGAAASAAFTIGFQEVKIKASCASDIHACHVK
ncbi:MAG: hypothetical protein N0E48_16030 [Candidatus Thiodiazotropha endolucinida]|nr:hypothetical protein [Candidatus Thiodiazotropha endolucinida]